MSYFDDQKYVLLIFFIHQIQTSSFKILLQYVTLFISYRGIAEVHTKHWVFLVYTSVDKQEFYLRDEQGAGVDDVYEVSETTEEWALENTVNS